jgi:DNA-binding response OmpR family regulator
VPEKPLVLVVEDEFLLAMPLEAHLADLNYDVKLAASARAAMAIIEAQAANFACLVTDIRLGAGPTGWELARWAREINAALPVIYMSGDSILDWTKWGVTDSLMLPKPFNLNQVSAALAGLISSMPA